MQFIFTTLIAGAVGLGGMAPQPERPAFAVPGAADGAETLWQAKSDKPGKGPKKVKGPGKKPERAARAQKGAQPQRAASMPPGQARKADGGATDEHARKDRAARAGKATAPQGRDMTAVLGMGGMILLSDDVTAASLTDAAGLTYRNCPPGLAKKDPPCVPPGLAKKGVTFEEWSGYDAERLDRIWLDRRETWLDGDRRPDDRRLLLSSDRVATLFGLDPAPAGQRYALIDGMPVLLDAEDYSALLLVNELAEVVGLDRGIDIAPTAALSQAELIRLYRLPRLADGQNYAVLNGQIVRLTDSEYETLQLIRIARAVL